MHEVIYSETATAHLLEAMATSGNAVGVLEAQERARANLAKDSAGFGVHLREGLYVCEERPPRVFFDINSDDMVVEIIGLKLAP